MIKFNIKPLDFDISPQLREKIDNLNKPKNSLGRLEELAWQAGLIQHSLSPTADKPHHVLFGADHGIEREGVSVSPREVTWQQMQNFTVGGGGVNLFCRQHNVRLHIVDVGVDHDFQERYKNTDDMPFPMVDRKIGYGTKNFLHEYAMTENEFDQALRVGADMVDECEADGCDVISFGEMGIGNTSPSSVWMYFFEGIPLDRCVGAGAGLNSSGISHKFKVLAEAVRTFVAEVGIDSSTPLVAPDDWTFIYQPGMTAPEPFRIQTPSQPYFPAYAAEIMRWFGGFEMIAAVGGMLRAVEKQMMVMVDGFIMTACALAACQLDPNAAGYMVYAHQGDEAGHALMLKAMGARPILNLGLKLGEGTGALCALPILQSAVRMINEMDNFQHAQITKYF